MSGASRQKTLDSALSPLRKGEERGCSSREHAPAPGSTWPGPITGGGKKASGAAVKGGGGKRGT